MAAVDTLRVLHKHHPNLTSISFADNAMITDASQVLHVVPETMLWDLNVAKCTEMEGDLSVVSPCTNLVSLNLCECTSLNGKLSDISPLTRLKYLNLRSVRASTRSHLISAYAQHGHQLSVAFTDPHDATRRDATHTTTIHPEA